MTQEQKQLLLRDLCARLPYGVKCKGRHSEIDLDDDSIRPRYIEREVTNEVTEIHRTKNYCSVHIGLMSECEIETVKPYLRPMSSMTDEERREAIKRSVAFYCKYDGKKEPTFIFDPTHFERLVDFYNEFHFDYRGLIPMGLAIEAPDGMYKGEAI